MTGDDRAAAESIWLQYLGKQLAGSPKTFEQLCLEHPRLATALRRCQEDWSRTASTRPTSQRVPERPALDTLIHRLAQPTARGRRYEIEYDIGRGAMGVVQRVWDRDLRRPLAMKTLKVNAREGWRQHVARFIEEAQIIAQLDHPSIVPVHDVGIDQHGRPFFVMKLVVGRDLRSVFELAWKGEEGWNETRVLGALLKVCEAVGYAHRKGVIHRDLKPSNILVGELGEVFVMDWGIARVLATGDEEVSSSSGESRAVHTVRSSVLRIDRESALHTEHGDVVGTAAYMSPEQAGGQVDQITARSDVYGIGAILYHLIARKPPYLKADATSGEVIQLVRAGPPLPLSVAQHDVAPELLAICDKAMARKPSLRHNDLTEVAADLRAFLEGRVVQTYETGTWAETKKWMRRNKALAIALVVILLVSAVGGAAFAAKARSERRAREAADRNAAEAKRQELVAAERTNEVLSLSAQEDVDDLVARAATLWPAHPEMIPKYECWLSDARGLIDGRPADEAKRIKRRPSLADHIAKLAELRTAAEPLNANQVEVDRKSHPRFAELQAKQAELTWRSRVLGVAPWPNEADVEAELSEESLPITADALNSMAWSMIGPFRPIYGNEVRALVIARRAVAAAAEVDRPRFRITLAWTLLRVGRVDEALTETRAALNESGSDAVKSSADKLLEVASAWQASKNTEWQAARDELVAEIAGIERAISERRTFEYQDADRTWWDHRLSKLVADLNALRDPVAGLMGNTLAAPFGWGIEKRYEFAKEIEQRTVTGATARQLWREATAAIKASSYYSGLDLNPQLGLLPIGTDPSSGLWEFAHLQTGEAPLRGADGKVVLTEETGLVFVLIPGGVFNMGAQNNDRNSPNYDPEATSDESPVHTVRISPYFLAKHEMTQAQWQRVAANRPCLHVLEDVLPALSPATQVNWSECKSLMDVLGLTLPSEAQWEYGARGGTTSAWWTGEERETVLGKMNTAERTAEIAGVDGGDVDEWRYLEDSRVVESLLGIWPSEVGTYPANGFGLHEVAGNVWEWCLDGWSAYEQNEVRDPVAPWRDAAMHVTRGGCFFYGAQYARSATRSGDPMELRDSAVGLRPARHITP